jgi:hypothetical protein
MKESEKKVEPKLRKAVEKAGGECIKLSPAFFIGIPDRLVLLPGGRAVFVETKSGGKKPSKIQAYVHKRLRAIGFDVRVIDSTEGINELLNDYNI